jgi:spermidine/putrescine-binding protein
MSSGGVHHKRRHWRLIAGATIAVGTAAVYLLSVSANLIQVFPTSSHEFAKAAYDAFSAYSGKWRAEIEHDRLTQVAIALTIMFALVFSFRKHIEERWQIRASRSEVRVVSWHGFRRPSLAKTAPTVRRLFGRKVHVVEYIKEIENVDTLRLNGYPIYVAVLDHEAVPDVHRESRLKILDHALHSKVELHEDRISTDDYNVPIMNGVGRFLAHCRLLRDKHGNLLGIPVRWGCNEILVRKGSHIQPESWADLSIDRLLEQLRAHERIGVLDWYFPALLAFLAADLAAANYSDLQFPLRTNELCAWMGQVGGKSCTKEDVTKFLVDRGTNIAKKIATAIGSNRIDLTADFQSLAHKLTLADYTSVPIVVGAGSMVDYGAAYHPVSPKEGVFSWIECLCLLAGRETDSEADAEHRAASFAAYAELLLSRRGQQILSGFGRDGSGPYSSIPISKDALQSEKVRKGLTERFGDLVRHNADDLHHLPITLWPRRIVDDWRMNYEIKRRWEQSWVEFVRGAAAAR